MFVRTTSPGSDIDICEFGSLVGTIATYLTGLVFAIQHTTCDQPVNVATCEPVNVDTDACLSPKLEFFATLVIMLTTALGLLSFVRVRWTVGRMKKVGLHKYLDETLEEQRNEQDKMLAMRKEQVDKQHARLQRKDTAVDDVETSGETANPTFVEDDAAESAE